MQVSCPKFCSDYAEFGIVGNLKTGKVIYRGSHKNIFYKVHMDFDLNDIRLDIDCTRVPREKSRKNERKSDTRFLKGPIPWQWLSVAARLPGKTLQVGVALWFIEGLTRTNVVKMQKKIRQEVGVSRTAYYAAIGRLEQAGLISVVRKNGSIATIHMLIQCS